MLSVEIARFVHRHEAETAVAFLEDAGIAVKLASTSSPRGSSRSVF